MEQQQQQQYHHQQQHHSIRQLRFFEYCSLIPPYDNDEQGEGPAESSSGSTTSSTGGRRRLSFTNNVATSPSGRPRLCTRAYSLPVPSSLTSIFAKDHIPAEFREDPAYFPASSTTRFNLRLPSITTRRKRSASASAAANPENLRSCLKGSCRGRSGRGQPPSDVASHVYCPALRKVTAQPDASPSSTKTPEAPLAPASSTTTTTTGTVAAPSTTIPEEDLPDDIVPLNACCKRCVRGTQYAEKADYVERFSKSAREKIERDNMAKYERGELKEYPRSTDQNTASTSTTAGATTTPTTAPRKNSFLAKLCSEEEEEVPLPPCMSAASEGSDGGTAIRPCPDVDELDRLRKRQAAREAEDYSCTSSSSSLDSCTEESGSETEIEASDLTFNGTLLTDITAGPGPTSTTSTGSDNMNRHHSSSTASSSSSSSSGSSADLDDFSSIGLSPASASDLLSPLTSVASLSDSENDDVGSDSKHTDDRQRRIDQHYHRPVTVGSPILEADDEDDKTPIATPKTRSLLNHQGISTPIPDADSTSSIPTTTGGSFPVRGNSLGLVSPPPPPAGAVAAPSAGGGGGQPLRRAPRYVGGQRCMRSGSSIVPGSKMHEEILAALQDADLTGGLPLGSPASHAASSSAPSSSSTFGDLFKGRNKRNSSSSKTESSTSTPAPAQLAPPDTLQSLPKRTTSRDGAENQGGAATATTRAGRTGAGAAGGSGNGGVGGGGGGGGGGWQKILSASKSLASMPAVH